MIAPGIVKSYAFVIAPVIVKSYAFVIASGIVKRIESDVLKSVHRDTTMKITNKMHYMY